MLLGSLVVIFVSVMTIAHYSYGVPIQDGNTGEPLTSANTLMTLLMLGGGGLLFLILGALLSRWNPD